MLSFFLQYSARTLRSVLSDYLHFYPLFLALIITTILLS